MKISWQQKKPSGDPKDKKYETVASGDIICDRAVIVPVNSHGDCGLALNGIAITEALGSIRKMLESDIWSTRDFIAKTDKDITLTLDIYPDDTHPEKVEHLEYLRGIVIALNHEDGGLDYYTFNVTRPECIGLLEMAIMMQLLTMGMQNALKNAVIGPQRGGMMKLPGFGDGGIPRGGLPPRF